MLRGLTFYSSPWHKSFLVQHCQGNDHLPPADRRLPEDTPLPASVLGSQDSICSSGTIPREFSPDRVCSCSCLLTCELRVSSSFPMPLWLRAFLCPCDRSLTWLSASLSGPAMTEQLRVTILWLFGAVMVEGGSGYLYYHSGNSLTRRVSHAQSRWRVQVYPV